MVILKRAILLCQRSGGFCGLPYANKCLAGVADGGWKYAWCSEGVFTSANVSSDKVWITPKVLMTLERMQTRYKELCSQLSDVSVLESGSLKSWNRELANLEPIVSLADNLQKKKQEIRNLESLLDESSEDPDLTKLASEERQQLLDQIPTIEKELVLELLPKDDDDDKPAIVEVRAGVGGDEGALFALDLFNMYWKYAAVYKWKVELLTLSKEEMGGCKEAAMAIVGTGVYGKLKYENGVHRVQRNPKTEVSDRIHTSTASVVVFPKVEEVDVELKPEDLQIEYTRASGAGGQHVNKTESAVRILHKPTGITVSMQDERSQHSNRKRALSILLGRLYAQEKMKQRETMSNVRKTAVGTGDRSARIRTYNFPQGRVTDHRIGLTEFGIEDMMNGLKLDKFVHALHLEEQLEKIEDFGTL